MIYLDFETFSAVDLRACGAYRYAEDPSTEVLIMCYAFDNGPVDAWRADQDLLEVPPVDLLDRIAAGDTVVAHNAQFERAIWHSVLHKRAGWPAIPIAQWYCTAAHAASLKLPRSLEGAGAAVGAPVQKDNDGVRLIRMFCMPRKPTKHNRSRRVLPQDNPVEFEKFVQYCRTDVASERALLRKLPPMWPPEIETWRYDTVINERGLPIDTVLVRRTLSTVEHLMQAVTQQTMELTSSADHPDGIAPTQRDKLLKYLQAEGAGLETLQRKEIEEQLDLFPFPDKVSRLLELRMESARASVKKLVSMLAVCSADGRARGTLLYHGAGPGRWSGKLIQPHNYTRGTYSQKQRDAVVSMLEQYGHEELGLLYERPMEAISNVMRAFICAPPGRVLYVADYSSIEARVLVWLAGQDDVVELYHKGVDLYLWMASKIYGVPEHSINPDTPEGFEQRRLGKQIVLGAGYGMGVPKFVTTCKVTGGFEVAPAIATLGIETYRATHSKVKRFWGDIENAAIECVRSGRNVACAAQGRIVFSMSGDDYLFMRLPSGRSISYPFPTLQPGKFGKDQLAYMSVDNHTHQWSREHTYGGKLTENAVQGIARDVMLHGMLRAERRGYEVTGTVHDEIISERDAGTGSVAEYERLVCTIPTWAAHCPITAKGFTAKRWKKA